MSTFYEEGYYMGQITAQAMTKASTGNPQFVLKFRVIETSKGEHVTRQYERTVYRTITDKTMQYFEKDLQTLGFNGSSLRELDPNNQNHQSFIGQTAEFSCKHEPDNNGDDREKWSIAWPQANEGTIEGEPLDAASFRKLDALFNRNKGNGNTHRQQPTQQQQSQPENDGPITDDDIPF